MDLWSRCMECTAIPFSGLPNTCTQKSHSACKGRNMWGNCCPPLLQQEQDWGEIPNCQMLLFPWPSCWNHTGDALMCWCLHCNPKVVVSDAAMYGRWRVQSSTRLHGMELQYRQQSQDHKGDPIVLLISSRKLKDIGEVIYTAQGSHQPLRKCTQMDFYGDQQMFILSKDSRELMAGETGL